MWLETSLVPTLVKGQVVVMDNDIAKAICILNNNQDLGCNNSVIAKKMLRDSPEPLHLAGTLGKL